MNAGQLIQTLIATIVGAVIGGLIVITTNWLKERGERRKATQERHEQTYIIDGIDPLVTYYQSLAISLINKSNYHTIPIVEKDVPFEALTKVRILLNDLAPLNIVLMVHSHLANTEDISMLGSAANLTQGAVEALLDYRVQLTTKILLSANSLHHEKETTRLTSRLQYVDSELTLLEEQRLEGKREFVPIKVPRSLPKSTEEWRGLRKGSKVRKDRFPRIK